MTTVLDYRPPPIAKEFIKKYIPGELFYTWIVGPFGSAKTTAMFFKLIYLAAMQAKSPDGIRYSRAVVVRNTFPQLRDNTLISWNYWFKDGVHGDWHASDKDFVLRFSDVECTVMFRPLDTPADVARVLGLEITFALIDEFREIPKAVFEGLSGRLGRFKPPGDVGCTNWGMFGASNPGTEDVWWHDYLHGVQAEDGHFGCVPVRCPLDPVAQADYQKLSGFPSDDETKTDADGNVSHVVNSWYYHQPSGFHKDAENLENLPGKRTYYTNLAKGKSKAWIKQYIDAEWGFSATGTPVISSFNADLHVAKTPLPYNSRLTLVIGADPGLGGSALIFMQQDGQGKVNVLGELVQRGLDTERIIKERLQPYVRARFPGAKILVAPDPASANRSSADGNNSKKIFKRYYPVAIESNNRLALRVNAYDHFFSTLIGGEPATQIDPVHCPVLIRALKGGWRFGIDIKKDDIKGAEAEKNSFSHPGDAAGYGYRYFHKGLAREERHAQTPIPKQDYRQNSYHAR